MLIQEESYVDLTETDETDAPPTEEKDASITLLVHFCLKSPHQITDAFTIFSKVMQTSKRRSDSS